VFGADGIPRYLVMKPLSHDTLVQHLKDVAKEREDAMRVFLERRRQGDPRTPYVGADYETSAIRALGNLRRLHGG
jgi:hypothetical protein